MGTRVRLISELKRRNVFRMALLYVVAAWLVMQVAGVLMDLGALPSHLGPWVLVALVIGFPIALIISWFYEITPAGLALEKDVPDGESITHVTGRRMDFIVIAVLSAGLILFAGDKWWPRGPTELSIAVLPFVNMSGDPEQEYFADGISEEILNLLAHIRPLKVIARTSSFSFKGKDADIATVAQKLNVRHILEGSVRHSGDRVRITAQLIDAKDSSHLWSQTFDRDYSAENLFYVQSEIARAITGRLRMTLTGDDTERLARVPTKNTEAYAAYLLGRQRLTDRKVAELADSVEHFALAVELDPRFAGAYSGLADACGLYKTYSGGHNHESCPPSPAERERFLRNALELDPESGELWISLGKAIRDQADGSLESMPKFHEAIAAYERGLELNPNLSQGYHWWGLAHQFIYVYPDPPSGWMEAWRAGVWEAAYDKGLDVDPLSVPLHYMKAIYPLVSKSKDDAIRHAYRIVEIAPDSPRGYEKLGEQQWKLNGRIDESVRWHSKALEMDPQTPSIPRSIGRAYSALGDPDMALAYFDLAKAVTAPDNQPVQHELLVEQAIIRLGSGEPDEYQVAELDALLSKSKNAMQVDINTYVDFTMGRPADALATIEAVMPECLGVKKIPLEYINCPTELVRVYQELGDRAAAQDLSDAIVNRAKLWFDGFPTGYSHLLYSGALAVAGRTDEALDVLEELVSSGWRGDHRSLLRFTLYFDVTFDAIRDHPRFQDAIATIEADMAQQLENVREMERKGELPTLKELRRQLGEETP